MSRETFGKMFSLSPKDIFSPIIAKNNIISTIYMAMLLLYFYLNKNFSILGNSDSVLILTVLLMLEVTKFYFFLSKKSNMEFRSKKKSVKLEKLLKGVVFIGQMLVLFYISAVLLGASILSKLEQTFILSCYLTSLSVVPVILYLEIDNVFALLDMMFQTPKDSLSNMILLQFQITILGAWLGAIPIPLDWDREWQIWPNSCVLGTLSGYLVSNVISFILQTTDFINRKVPSFRCML